MNKKIGVFIVVVALMTTSDCIRAEEAAAKPDKPDATETSSNEEEPDQNKPQTDIKNFYWNDSLDSVQPGFYDFWNPQSQSMERLYFGPASVDVPIQPYIPVFSPDSPAYPLIQNRAFGVYSNPERGVLYFGPVTQFQSIRERLLKYSK